MLLGNDATRIVERVRKVGLTLRVGDRSQPVVVVVAVANHRPLRVRLGRRLDDFDHPILIVIPVPPRSSGLVGDLLGQAILQRDDRLAVQGVDHRRLLR